MGKNMGSCFCPSKPVKIIRFNNGLERFAVKKGATVAEVMMDNPNQFVCELGNLQAGQRIEAVPAHEELKQDKIYALLPMHRLYFVPSLSEMNAFNAHVHRNSRGAQKNGRPNSKITPVSEKGLEYTVLPKFEVEKIARKQWECLKKGGCGNWKPALHTIYEFPSTKA